MSGGYFDYRQCFLHYMAESIEEAIRDHKFEDPRTLVACKEAVDLLHQAYVYVHRIDLYLSGDDGDETFSKLLARDLIRWEEKKNAKE